MFTWLMCEQVQSYLIVNLTMLLVINPAKLNYEKNYFNIIVHARNVIYFGTNRLQIG
jgi:hypothetical protein